ncbi:guanine nucleotide binding protein, alpha subunit [Scleroderma citrinum]
MGQHVSSARERANNKARSDAIDRQLEEDFKRLKNECKVLILGTRDSGKSNIVKQMKLIHQNGFTYEELMSYRPTIYRNTIHSARSIIVAMRKINVDCMNPLNRDNADKILDYKVDSSPHFVLSPEIAQAIHELWQDPIIPTILDHSSEFHLMDSAAYFFNEVLRIGMHNYLPTANDVLRACDDSTGIKDTCFKMGQLSMHIIDVGDQNPERRKWIHCFESVTSIIFCVNLSEYDQVLLEDKGLACIFNRLEESLILFDSVVNSRWFLRTAIILFFTKIDVFKVKLPKVPLEKYFPEYTGGTDVNKAAKYILWRFMQANRARLSVYPHFTHEWDTSNIRLVFTAVKETILRNALNDACRF